MDIVFYIASIVAIFSTIMVITRANAVHALLYMIVSLFSVAIVMYGLGAPFVAALEVIVYAGAIMVLFIFVVMMLNLGKETEEKERQLLQPKIWAGPSLLAAILFAEFIFMLVHGQFHLTGSAVIEAGDVGYSLFTSYMLGVELAAMLLLAGLVGAFHLGKNLR